MREIKFRIWSPIHKEFWYINLGDKFEFKASDVIMQYTGLKDKNNVEVYEGDIVKNTESVGLVKFIYGAFKIDWKNGEWDLLSDYSENGYMEKDYNLGIEVIGNIYENPELLKRGDK